MKKRILTLILLCAFILPSCQGTADVKNESSGEVISSDASKNEDFAENSFDESFSSGDAQASSEIEDTSSMESNAESSLEENSEISTESKESSEISFEESSSTEQSKDESSQKPSDSSSDASYESFDTPVVEVPSALTSAQEDAFFNDSVFVGNSIMLGYQKFANNQRAGSISDFLGTAKFFCAGSFGVYHNNRTPATNKDASNPSYAGVKYSVEDAVGVMGVKTVYINFMGLNDLSLYYDSKNCSRKCADDVIAMIKRINAKYPDVKVVILSATYLTKSTNNMASLNNKNLSLLNNYLLEYCNENGLDFVDIASQLTEKGCLADKYASDGYCHIGKSGYNIWTAILRDYAVRKMDGTYQNPEKMPILGINK